MISPPEVLLSFAGQTQTHNTSSSECTLFENNPT
jgi:hypothetical protein